MSATTDREAAVRWHAERRKAILRAHPEVRQLYGHDWTTALWVAGVAALQVALTFSVEGLRWPWVLLLAYAVGALPAHALGVLIHEAGHNLVFRRTWANKLLAIAANIPLGAPAAIEFRAQHARHHRALGDTAEDGGDTQAPVPKEIQFGGSSSARKLLSFTFGRFFYAQRPANKVRFDAWMGLNWGACIAYGAAVWWFGGAKCFTFGMVAALAAFGPHPTGARRISEHLTLRRGQPSNSYYGPLNLLSFGVGYHVEHHDFPNVPWRGVLRLRRIAPEFYEPLGSVRSWTGLLVRFVFDPRYRIDQYTGAGGSFVEELEAGLPQTLH